jgi:ABC-type sugar transport system permease subunit
VIGERSNRAWCFIAFPVAIVFLFTALPTVAGIALSFFEWSGGRSPRWIGGQNYVDLVNSNAFWPALRNTLIFAATTVPITVLVAFLVGCGLAAPWFRGRITARTILFLPTVVSIVAIGFIWRWILDPSPSGLLNHLLLSLGFHRDHLPQWLGGASPVALASIVAVSIWRGLGYSIVLYLAAIANVSQSLYEAAAVDGARSWRSMWSITWPSVRPMTFFLLVTGMIGAIQVFDILIVMVGKEQQEWTDVLNLFLYREFSHNRLGFAATLGVIILALTLLITWGQFRAFKERTGVEA